MKKKNNVIKVVVENQTHRIIDMIIGGVLTVAFCEALAETGIVKKTKE